MARVASAGHSAVSGMTSDQRPDLITERMICGPQVTASPTGRPHAPMARGRAPSPAHRPSLQPNNPRVATPVLAAPQKRENLFASHDLRPTGTDSRAKRLDPRRSLRRAPRWRQRFLAAVADLLTLRPNPTNRDVATAVSTARRTLALGISPPSLD